MRRSLSQALRFLSLGSDPLLRKITQAPPPEPSSLLSLLLTELGEVLLAEDERKIALEQYLEIQNLLTEDNLVLLTEDGRKIALEQYLEIQKYLLTEDNLVLLTEDGRGLELG